MTTTTAAKSSADRYINLVREFPLRPIRDEDEHAQSIAVLDRISDRDELTPEEHDYVTVLGLLVEAYENSADEHPGFSGPEMLRFLIEEHGLTLTGLAEETGVPVTSLSDIVHGRRGISPKVRPKLCERFAVDPSVFL